LLNRKAARTHPAQAAILGKIQFLPSAIPPSSAKNKRGPNLPPQTIAVKDYLPLPSASASISRRNHRSVGICNLHFLQIAFFGQFAFRKDISDMRRQVIGRHLPLLVVRSIYS
jgi:hypothetical protein